MADQQDDQAPQSGSAPVRADGTAHLSRRTAIKKLGLTAVVTSGLLLTDELGRTIGGDSATAAPQIPTATGLTATPNGGTVAAGSTIQFEVLVGSPNVHHLLQGVVRNVLSGNFKSLIHEEQDLPLVNGAVGGTWTVPNTPGLGFFLSATFQSSDPNYATSFSNIINFTVGVGSSRSGMKSGAPTRTRTIA